MESKPSIPYPLKKYLTATVPAKKMDPITIEKIVNGGLALSRLLSGEVILTTAALPQEVVTVTITQKKKNFSLAKIKEIHTPSPCRIPPKCPHQECGGCDLNHCTYSGQIAVKEEIIDDLIERNNLIKYIPKREKATTQERQNIRRPILAAKEHYHYRQRIRLQCANGRLGFRAKGSHSLIEINSCLLAPKEINSALKELRQNKEFSLLLQNSSEIELLYNPSKERGEKSILLLLHFTRKPRPADKKNASSYLNESSHIESIFFIGKDFAQTPANEKCTKEISYCYKDVGKRQLTLHYSFEAGGFSQLHLDQNRLLIERVLHYAKEKPKEKGEESPRQSILDLYCGMGNFSVPLALLGADVIGIEGQGAAVRSAKRNMESNLQINTGIDAGSTIFKKSPVHIFCKEAASNGQKFATIIIDPPRSGAPNLAPLLAKLAKKRLIYISCDPASLMRDIQALLQEGFTLTALQPIDMFPQTHHIEIIAVFDKPHYLR